MANCSSDTSTPDTTTLLEFLRLAAFKADDGGDNFPPDLGQCKFVIRDGKVVDRILDHQVKLTGCCALDELPAVEMV